MSVDLFVDYLSEVSREIDERLRQDLAVVPKGSALDRYLYEILDEFVGRGGSGCGRHGHVACVAVGGSLVLRCPAGWPLVFPTPRSLIHDEFLDASVMRAIRSAPTYCMVHPWPSRGDYALGWWAPSWYATLTLRLPQVASARHHRRVMPASVEGQALEVGWVRDDVTYLTPDDYWRWLWRKDGSTAASRPDPLGLSWVVHRRSRSQPWQSSERTPPSLFRSRTTFSTYSETSAPWARTT